MPTDICKDWNLNGSYITADHNITFGIVSITMRYNVWCQRAKVNQKDGLDTTMLGILLEMDQRSGDSQAT